MITASIILPVYNEASIIDETLTALERVSGIHEIIIVDGGSTDLTCCIIRDRHPAVTLLSDPALRGRACQMNAGANLALGEILIFCHADTQIPPDALAQIDEAVEHGGAEAGGFLKRYSPSPPLLVLYAFLQNTLCGRFLKHFVGTNAIFIRRDVFHTLGGYRLLPFLEDIDLCDRLHRGGYRLVALRGPVHVSARRYLAEGILRRVMIAGTIIYLYRIRKWSPEKLVEYYRGRKTS
jgi:rSAM/selenodomain-associated transferase 2